MNHLLDTSPSKSQQVSNRSTWPEVLRIAIDPKGNIGKYNSNLKLIKPLPGYFLMQYIIQKLRTRCETIFVNESQSLLPLVYSGEADISINQFRINEFEQKYVDFSAPYLVREIKFATEEAGRKLKFEAFGSPFSIDVWILCLLVAIGATWISKWITSSKASFANIFVGIVGSILRQPLSIEIGSPKKIIWWATWLIWSTIISTSYSALFLSFLLAPTKETTIKTLPELSTAVQNKRYHCGSHLYLKNFMSKSNLNYIKKLDEGCLESSDVEITCEFVDKTSALIANHMYISLMQLEPPSRVLVVSEDTLAVWFVGIAMGKHFCCKDSVNVAVLSAVSAGLVQKWYEESLRSYTWANELRRWKYQEEETRALGMADLQYVFIVFLFGTALSLVVFLCEILVQKPIAKNFVLYPIKNIFEF